jgi:hypothetical protein
MGKGQLLLDYLHYWTNPSSIPIGLSLTFFTIHFGLMAYFGWSMYTKLRKYRLMADTPTSKIRSAAQGFVELKGRTKELQTTTSPLTGTPAVWWSYKVEELSGGGNNRSWDVIKEDTSIEAFIIKDDTGECVVHPENATLYPHHSKVWRGHTSSPNPLLLKNSSSSILTGGNYRYTEHLLMINAPIYALGMYHTFHPREALPDVGEIIREWKKDYQALVDKYDTNKDGQLDEQEWQQVIAAAELELMQKQSHMDNNKEKYPPVNILSCEGLPKRRVFILSGQSEKELILKKARKAKLYVAGFFMFAAHNLYTVFCLL